MPIERHPDNPILTRQDIPEIRPDLVDVSSVFNPAAVRHGDHDLLMLRIQTRGRETRLLMAASPDGVHFDVTREPVRLRGIERIPETIHHVYDPRITPLEGAYYGLLAMDTDTGCRLGLMRTEDFKTFAFLGVTTGEDVRNGVLFPQRVGGRYLRLERPNRARLDAGTVSGSEIILSQSENLIDWRIVAPVMTGRPHYWDELIGSGPPPVKTRAGWLHIYHGIATHFAAANVYQAGVVLLDLEDPARVVARGRRNILEPREMYELVGQVPNVVFPSGMIVERFDEQGYAEPGSRVRIYYGAADTCVGLACTTIDELLSACGD